MPTLLIWGGLDARSPLTGARQFEQAIPDTRLVVIPGSGHISNLEQPERVNHAVREFCRARGQRESGIAAGSPQRVALGDPVLDGARARRMGRAPELRGPGTGLEFPTEGATAPSEGKCNADDQGNPDHELRGRRDARPHLGEAELADRAGDRPGARVAGAGAGAERGGRDPRARGGSRRHRLRCRRADRRRGQADLERLLTEDARGGASPRRRARRRERRVPGDRRRANRARRRLGRRRDLPVRLHADGRHGRRTGRDAPRAAAAWPARARRLGPPERNPFFSILGGKLVERGHVPPPEPPPAPGIFAMGSEERTAQLLEGSGFGDVRTEEVEVRFPVPSVKEYLEFTADTAGPIAIALRGVSEEDREALEPELEEAFAPFVTGDGYELPGVTLCAVAR